MKEEKIQKKKIRKSWLLQTERRRGDELRKRKRNLKQEEDEMR
jgi:hypothetical protein